jgi:hypothetical protein
MAGPSTNGSSFAFWEAGGAIRFLGVQPGVSAVPRRTVFLHEPVPEQIIDRQRPPDENPELVVAGVGN